jgi:hypothetical protein
VRVTYVVLSAVPGTLRKRFLSRNQTSELTTGVASTTKALAGEVATNLQAWTKAVRRMPRFSELSPAAVPVA